MTKDLGVLTADDCALVLIDYRTRSEARSPGSRESWRLFVPLSVWRYRRMS
jgi:hypothetical protein